MTIKKFSLFIISLALALPLCSADYNPSEAKEYAYASALAHCTPSSIQAWNCGAACVNLTGYQYFYSEVVNVTIGQTLAFAMISNPSTKKFITTFRGSVGSIQILLEVLQGQSTPYNLSSVPGAQVDYYFYFKYANYLRDTIFEQLGEAYQKYPDYEFVFTGHSLGAAFSILAAFDMASLDLIPSDKIVIYNYGCPRVGNYIFAQAVQSSIKKIYRVTHWRDPVIHLPFCKQDKTGKCITTKGTETEEGNGILWAAYHVEKEIFYDEPSTQYTVCNGGEDTSCSDQFGLQNMKVDNHLYYVNVHMECDKDSRYENEEYENFIKLLEIII